MKLQKIKTIETYKSFQFFSWQKFLNNETLHNDVNIFYGENGSGKSSICNILKSVSGEKEFEKYSPNGVCLLFDDGENSYSEKDKWANSIAKESMLFFDREFVDKNLHLGHSRDRQHGGQEQESGKLIIEFDSEAITLRAARNKFKLEKDEKQRLLETFRSKNKEILAFALDENEKELFEKLKGHSQEDIAEVRKQLEKNKLHLLKTLEADKGKQKKVLEIQNIEELKNESVYISLTNYKAYQGFFDYDLKEQTKIQAEHGLIKKIQHDKTFFETGFNIRKIHPDQCPFCQTKNEEESIQGIIKAYNEIFDDTYNAQLKIFQDTKDTLLKELEAIKSKLAGFNINAIFLELKKLDQSHKIEGIYSVEEEKSYKKPEMEQLENLVAKIAGLKKPDKDNIKELYDQVRGEFKTIEKWFGNTSSLIEDKNKVIRKFKKENTDAKLQARVSDDQEKVHVVNKTLAFLSDNKRDKQIQKEKILQELKAAEKLVQAEKERLKKARQDYENYVSQEAFFKLLQKIEVYFENFNFNFSLKLDEERNTGTTREFPFAFKVLDAEGNERDFKEGLSEGELQVLSLCFFFAFLDIQSDKNNKVLVFDDPITSLDNSNLSCLVDLVAEKKKEFSQTLIFTHHRTFFKFLRNKFNNRSEEYNILRNGKELGGSFICKSKPEKFLTKLSQFENHLQTIPPESLDIELKIVEYGQYLRYEAERFIKNTLLHWNAHDFRTAIDGVKKNKNIDDNDLDKVKGIYSFCNWTTSHVDVGDDHGLEQLKSKIKEFVEVVNCY